MADNATRIIGIACLLVGVWIVAYWVWTPMGPRVTVDQRPGMLPAEPAPDANQTRAEETAPKPSPESGEAASAKPDAETRTVSRVLAPKFRDYVVQAGDTSFEKIAARPEVFGDAKKGEAIARSNKFADPTKLKVGVTMLRIPLDPENIEGKVVQVVESPGGPPTVIPDPPAVTPPAPPAEPMRTYTFKQGDTLWDVAKKFYGKGAMWKLIAEANRDVLPRPDHPAVGVTIRIPPEPAENKPTR